MNTININTLVYCVSSKKGKSLRTGFRTVKAFWPPFRDLFGLIKSPCQQHEKRTVFLFLVSSFLQFDSE